ncbi:MAG: HprK-related kinase A [Gammaproteobacteria bacterium]|nr:HprK-related kinase A [Planctomycetaceae bacterium]MCP5346842.1 HprK-related kinase A [Pseudomonadales bacterium]
MFVINSGEFLFEIQHLPAFVLRPLRAIYGDQPPEALDGPADFRVSLRCDSLVRRFLRPQITFYSDRQAPFKPVARSQAFATLEWGMNWCVAAYDYTRLIIHAAVLEKNGRALIFPAAPGSGKSTLSAYLAFNGWNLFSDEMAIIDLTTGKVAPVFRPMCLKNESIELVRGWYPNAVMTQIAHDTQKGDVAHLKALDWQKFKSLHKTPVVGVVFPQFRANAALTVKKMQQIETFRQLCSHAFNYNIVGRPAFDLIGRLTLDTDHYSVTYCDLAEVNGFLVEEFGE